MRVTIVSRDFPPTVGGIADHTDLVATELVRRDIQVSVVCSPPADERATVDVRPVVRRWDARGYDRIAAEVAETRPDVIVWQYNPFAVGRKGVAPTAGRLARALAARAPLVLLLHELWFPWGRAALRGLVWATSHRLQARAVLGAAARWVVTTEHRRDELATRFPAHRERIRVLPIGSNVEPTGKRDRAALGIPDDAFVLAHLGGVGPGRDLGPAIDALVAMRARGIDARLLLAGKTGPFRVPPALDGAVVTTGIVSRDELSNALASADAYIHPDRVGPAAGRRGSLVAAMAHGLPIVAYRGPDHAPQLRDGENVVLVEPAGEAVRAALEHLHADPAAARAIGERARDTYRTSFAWDRVGERLTEILQETTR